MSTALVLAGHGSHLNARSSEAVRAHARTLATSDTWDEVLVAFWKEEPSLARALDGCTASDVTVVPVFMSEGYFTSEVIPAEMGLDGPVTRQKGRTIRCTRPVGVHPALAGIIVIVERARPLPIAPASRSRDPHGSKSPTRSSCSATARDSRANRRGTHPGIIDLAPSASRSSACRAMDRVPSRNPSLRHRRTTRLHRPGNAPNARPKRTLGFPCPEYPRTRPRPKDAPTAVSGVAFSSALLRDALREASAGTGTSVNIRSVAEVAATKGSRTRLPTSATPTPSCGVPRVGRATVSGTHPGLPGRHHADLALPDFGSGVERDDSLHG